MLRPCCIMRVRIHKPGVIAMYPNIPLAAVGVTEKERRKIIKRSCTIKALFHLCLRYNQYYILAYKPVIFNVRFITSPFVLYALAVIFDSVAECFRRQRTVKLPRRQQLVRAKLPVVVCAASNCMHDIRLLSANWKFLTTSVYPHKAHRRVLYVCLWLATGQLNEHESHNVDKNHAASVRIPRQKIQMVAPEKRTKGRSNRALREKTKARTNGKISLPAAMLLQS